MGTRSGSRSGVAVAQTVMAYLARKSDATPAAPLTVAAACPSRLPALVVVGRHDALTPVDGACVLQEQIADATLEGIDGGGHMVANEQPRAFARAACVDRSGTAWYETQQ